MSKQTGVQWSTVSEPKKEEAALPAPTAGVSGSLAERIYAAHVLKVPAVEWANLAKNARLAALVFFQSEEPK